MPEFQLTDSIITQLNAQEPWPDSVKLFQPYEVEQILLPDNASCLAVQAFLKMCNLPFEVEMRWNAEFMSPSGRVPFIKCGAFVVSELEPIVQFAANKGVSLCGRLATEEKAEMRAYMSLITNVLVNAELYISWVDNDTFNAVTKIRNSSVYPWPLGWLQTRAKRNSVIKRLKALHWHDKSLEQVLADVEQCCNSLSQRLGDRDYFFGTTPTPLDALLFGHMRALLSAHGPRAAIMIRPVTSSLLKHMLRMVNATQMKITPQEEYLLTQAFQVSRQRLSPGRTASERSTRVKRSKLCIRNTSKENVTYAKDLFGFKPFASKQIVIMTTKAGDITCFETTTKSGLLYEEYQFIIEILDDVLDKVEESIIDMFTDTIDTEKLGFEVIAYPSNTDSRYDSVDMKGSDYLDTIEENDVTDTSASLQTQMGGKGVYMGNDEGLLLPKELEREASVRQMSLERKASVRQMNLEREASVRNMNLERESSVRQMSLEREASVRHMSSDVTDSSNDQHMKGHKYINVCNSGDGISSKSLSTKSAASSGSSSTLKMPSSEEISVECLLKYLRKRNAVFNYTEVADID